MKLPFLQLTKCRTCSTRPAFVSGMCRQCWRMFSTHPDMKRLETFLDSFYPRIPS